MKTINLKVFAHAKLIADGNFFVYTPHTTEKFFYATGAPESNSMRWKIFRTIFGVNLFYGIMRPFSN